MNFQDEARLRGSFEIRVFMPIAIASWMYCVT